MASLAAFAFEVHGRVQGVYFRNHTVQEAQRLGLVGWVANTARGTVVGEAQGKEGQVQHLREEGSPASRIDRLDVTHERTLDKLEFQSFQRRPNMP